MGYISIYYILIKKMDFTNATLEGKKDYKRKLTSIQITPEFHQLCKEHHIQFSEALRVGVSILLADKGIKPYDNHLNIYRKMKKFQAIAQESSFKAAEMEERLKKIEKEHPEVTKQIEQMIQEGEEKQNEE